MARLGMLTDVHSRAFPLLHMDPFQQRAASMDAQTHPGSPGLSDEVTNAGSRTLPVCTQGTHAFSPYVCVFHIVSQNALET